MKFTIKNIDFCLVFKPFINFLGETCIFTFKV